jgi:hypothetical protein
VRYGGVGVFSEHCDLLTEEIILSKGERDLLAMGPKYCVYKDCSKEQFLNFFEVAFVKYKWEKGSEVEEEKGLEDKKPSKEEQEEDDKIKEAMLEEEARSRSIYLPEEKRFDYTKKRATDCKQNTEVHLPGPLNVRDEAMLEMMRLECGACYDKFTKERVNKKGEKEANLTPTQKEGLKSLRTRIKEGEIVVMPTNKSGRFCIMDIETYVMAGSKLS